MPNARPFWKQPGYIIAQICTIFAIMAGVYWATFTGYKSVIDFHNIKYDRASYRLQSALESELLRNIGELEKHFDSWGAIDETNITGNLPSIDSSIWQSSRKNELIFSIPTSVVLGIGEFNKYTTRAIKAHSEQTISREDMMSVLITQRDKARGEILPALESSRDALRSKLNQYSINLN